MDSINFQELLSGDNTTRNRAESAIKDLSSSEPNTLATLLLQGVSKEQPAEVQMIACVILKKYFLDPLAKIQLPAADLESIKTAIQESVDISSQSLLVLKRKADILSKIFSKLEQNQLFFQSLSALFESEDQKSREFALYGFEIMSEMSL